MSARMCGAGLGLLLWMAAAASAEESALAAPPLSAERRAELQKLLRGLQSEEWTQREEAAQALKKFGKALLPYLSKLKLEGRPELAWRVKKLAREVKFQSDPVLRKRLADLLNGYAEQPPSERLQIISKMVLRAHGACVPLLLDLLETESNAMVQQAIVRQLSWLPAGPELLKPLLKFYLHCGEEVKGETLYALAGFPSPEARRQVRAALQSQSPGLLRYAVLSAIRLNDRASLPALRRLAEGKGDPGESIRINALKALVSLVDRSAGPVFTKALDGSLNMQRAALKGIAGLRLKAMTPRLVERFQDENHKEMRDALAECMGALGDPSFSPLLTACLKQGPASLRITAVNALRRMRAKQAAPKIAVLLQEADSDVRKAAAGALATLGYREANALIKEKLLNDPDLDTALVGARALANLGDPTGRKRIVQIAALRRRPPARATQEALALIGDWHIRAGLPLLRARAKDGGDAILWPLFQFEHDPEAFRGLLKTFLLAYWKDPQSSWTTGRLASLLEARGLLGRAAALRETMRRRQPRDTGNLQRLASLYHAAGRFADCEAAFQQLEALQGNNAAYLNNRAWFYCTAFRKAYLRPKQALRMVERALSLEPNSTYFVDTRGWTLHQLGRYGEAVRDLRRALELKEAADSDGVAWERTRLARSLWAAGQKKEALQQVARALREAPFKDETWFEAAGFYAATGKRDEAVHALHMAVEKGYIQVASMLLNPEFASLRHDEGYTYAIQRARRRHAAVERMVDEMETQIRIALDAQKKGRTAAGVIIVDH